MYVHWLSDQHWNWISPKELLAYGHKLGNSIQSEDHITISGDLSDGDCLVANLVNFVNAVREVRNDAKISFVLGNHDYWGTSIDHQQKDVLSAAKTLGITYLTKENATILSSNTALVGTDGWADGGFGNAHGPLIMGDWTCIKDLKPIYKVFGVGKLTDFVKKLAEQEVANVASKISKIVSSHENIIIVTHIPPWKEATWHEDAISNNTFLPWFSSKIMGEYLLDVANINKDNKFTVLCSHTHGAGVFIAANNLRCYTGFADYRHPQRAGLLRVDSTGVTMEEFHNPHNNRID
jgi:predicted phosphohydrolase